MAMRQAQIAEEMGCRAVVVAPGASGEYVLNGSMDLSALATLEGFHSVALWASDDALRKVRIALAGRDGRLIPLLAERDMAERCLLERHICIDTTAAGGNASLLAEAS
jgi:RHH-type proline utilization regulon transcriptional repressor/proline dehydrogenase/delta 1-pyrroline-5-carboxylate dehydrogenase